MSGCRIGKVTYKNPKVTSLPAPKLSSEINLFSQAMEVVRREGNEVKAAGYFVMTDDLRYADFSGNTMKAIAGCEDLKSRIFEFWNGG